MIGRTAGLLIDLPVDTTTRGWRLADRPGRDLRRAQSLLARDLDALEEAADGYQGPLKLQVCGPWTMAASLELARSQEPVLADPGALRDLTESLAEGISAHVAGVAARVPGARLLLQVDEPALPAVLAGADPERQRVQPGPAGRGSRRRVGPARGAVRDRGPHRRALLRSVGPPWHHQEGGRGRGGHRPWRAAPGGGRGAGGGGRGGPRDLRRARCLPRRSRLPPRQHQPAGCGPTAPHRTLVLRNAAVQAHCPTPGQPPTGWWSCGAGWGGRRRREPGAAGVAAQVVITPGCGLAGAPPDYARAALARCREAARMLPELIEEEAP